MSPRARATPRPEPGRQVDALEQIVLTRRKQGLPPYSKEKPPYSKENKKSGTVARIEYNGKVEYGGSPGISPYENLPWSVRWVLDKVKNTYKNGAVKIMVTHAEAEALTRAGARGEVVLYVDRPTCDFCKIGLPYLLKELRITKLTIKDANNLQGIDLYPAR